MKLCYLYLQNTTAAWEVDDPDLTTCFEQTILIWIPCAFLWLFSIIELHYIRRSPNKNIPWTWKNVIKLGLTVFLIILTFVDIGIAISKQDAFAVHQVHFYTPVIKIASFVLAACLLYYNKVNGLRTSGLLFLFWLSLVIFSVPTCRTHIRFRESQELNEWDNYQFISFMIFFGSSIIILFVNCFADNEPRESIHQKTEVR